MRFTRRFPFVAGSSISGVAEPRRFRDDAQQHAAGAARAMLAHLPLADRLLARAKVIGEFILRQSQMLPERAHLLGGPFTCDTIGRAPRRAAWSSLHAGATFFTW